MDTKKVAVVIVSYNVCRLLDECLQSVRKALEGIDGEVFVVDNRSSDGTVETLQPRYPEVHFVANSENVGFARANNQAIRQSQSEYVLLLTPTRWFTKTPSAARWIFSTPIPRRVGQGSAC